MKVIKFPSINQFIHLVSSVKRRYEFVGLDENEIAIYDSSKPKPILTFTGSVKLHGTNAAVCYNENDGIWYQSRTDFITPEHDNAGFASFATYRKDIFMNFFNEIYEREKLDPKEFSISIYGEFVGKGIQKGVGISKLDKSMFIFGVKITPHTETEEEQKENPAYWVDHSTFKSEDDRIYNIEDYKTYSIDIDFNDPKSVEEKLTELTLSVENECPISKEFGFEHTMGEGIVWYCINEGSVLRFKTKGEKHKNKVEKERKPIDNEKLDRINKVVQLVTPDWRLEQMLDETFNLMNGGVLDIKKLGDYIKAVIKDIVKEELLLITENDLEMRDINKFISNVARDYFLEKYNESIMN